MQIEAGQVVTLTFTATDDSGKVLERQTPPTAYLHGHDNFIATLEAALGGLGAGEAFDVTIEEAYGAEPTSEPVAVPRKEFPKNWRFEVGMAFTAPGSGDSSATLYVHGVRGSRVNVSPHHPWAGRKVNFKGEILQVRSATMEERQHGHAHGPGGAH